MKILAVIAARGGSKGVKDKNIRALLGKPLIVYTIEQIMRWGKYDRFIVSTESEEIARIAREHGAEVPFVRPAELASDTAGKLDVLRHALIEAERHYNMRFDALLDLDVTAPIRTVEDIENITGLFKEKSPDCIFSVVKARKNPYFNMVEQNADGTVSLCKELQHAVQRRQDAPEVYDMNASMYIYKRGFLLDENNTTPCSGKTLVYEMEELSQFDIDNEVDLRFVEFLAREGLVGI